MTELPNVSVLVRTWFGDDAAWDALLSEVRTPSADGFLAGVTPVDDPVFAGLGVDALTAKQQTGPLVSFLADEATLTRAEHPILAVWVHGAGARHEHPPFRVVPAALWSVENNINLGNMDWSDFTAAAGEDGVFRGF
ncbi:DUF6924 domain-containing protein [Actinophytocola sp. KF-1]